MKKMLIAMLFALPVAGWAKVSPGVYDLTVHVQASHLGSDTKGSSSLMRTSSKLILDVVIDGKKLELSGDTSDLLRVGDYKARLIDTPADGPDYIDHRKYEFYFPDGKTREFQVVGESE